MMRRNFSYRTEEHVQRIFNPLFLFSGYYLVIFKQVVEKDVETDMEIIEVFTDQIDNFIAENENSRRELLLNAEIKDTNIEIS